MKKQWQLLEPERSVIRTIRSLLHCCPATAAVLANRGITAPEAVSQFSRASLRDLRAPFDIKDIELAVRRIHLALQKKEKILIFGDYDVDGVTATAIMLEFLQHAGADVTYYIPHRIDEGYGLRSYHIDTVVKAREIDLLVTVDCGSSSHRAVDLARQSGIDVIITDHHQIDATLPSALAVINPQRSDCPSRLENLAGVGVAFFLLIALRKYLRDNAFWQQRPEPNLKAYTDLVALGTLGDVVSLTGENRILAKTGIELIRNGSRLGLGAMTKAIGMTGERFNSEAIAYKLIPRLNAAGRMAHAQTALELILANDKTDAGRTSRTLDELNTLRRSTEAEILAEVENYINRNPSILQKKAIVLARSGWHVGVLGIVASRLIRQYFLPVILISSDGSIAKGSARSIPGLNIYEAISGCSDHLEYFGGHAMAAGLTLKTENIKMFQEQFHQVVRDTTTTDDFTDKMVIDYELKFDEVTDTLLNELESLEPFGTDNPSPLFMARDVEVTYSQIVGRHHRRLRLQQFQGARGKKINAIHFNIDPDQPAPKTYSRIAFQLQWNCWNGNKTPQIVIQDIAPMKTA